METTFKQWRDFLNITPETVATLEQFYWVVEQNIDCLLDEVYAHLLSQSDTALFYNDPLTMQRARKHQRNHWLKYVFKGCFDRSYLDAAQRIGRTHHKLGVELKYYSGAYAIVMNKLARLVRDSLGDCVEEEFRYLAALNKAMFLDMGLATSVYYDSVSAELEMLAHELNFSLAKAGEFRDNETGEHILRMSRMCERLAFIAGQDEEWCKRIRIASPLHDVGKIGIPDSILLKPSKLEPNEWQVMRQHPGIGGDIVPDNNSDLIQMAKRISLTHHEKWDGTGYPVGLKEMEIPLEGRIAAICDVFDALLSKRPYKKPWELEDAVSYLVENKAKHFDPQLVELFVEDIETMISIRGQFQEIEIADNKQPVM